MLSIARLPLAKKLVIFSTTTSLIALVIASSAWIVDSWLSGRESLAQEMKTLSQLIANRSNAALAFGDAELAQQNLRTLANLPNILSACIYDQDKQLFASHQKADIEPLPCQSRPDDSVETLIDRNSILIFTPVQLEDRTIGQLSIRSDLSRVNRQARSDMLGAALIFLLASVVAYVISTRLQRLISKPVKQLSHLAREVAENRNYTIRADKQSDDELGALVDAFNDMLDTIEVQNRSLLDSRDQLEILVEKRTDELQASNRELEAFCYSVSHDLRAPLRSINGFSQALLEDYNDILDEDGQDYLQRVMRSATRMGKLIDDLLSLSRVARSQLKPQKIDLSSLSEDIIEEITEGMDFQGAVEIQPAISAYGDPTLMRVVMTNLLGNAFKYSAKKENPKIDFGCARQNGEAVYRVRDNGAGFDMQYADKLFATFQRLHRDEDFEGTGIGLASVARVVHRHGGRVWAEGEVGKGACFYFTLDAENINNGKTASPDA